MNWYKKSQDYPYSLLEKIRMQENGLSLLAMDFYELKEAKELEKNGFINKEIKQDESGKYSAYVINKEKFEQMGWNTKTGCKKANINKKIQQEAGLKENILTMALASLFLLPLDIMAFKYLKNRQPNVPTELIIDNIKQAKQIKENVETGKYTTEEKNVYDQANNLKNEIKVNKAQNVNLNNLVNVILQHENLIPKQTPFRITNEKMRQWDHIHGFEIDKVNPSPQERANLKRQNFIFLKNQNDVSTAVVTQFKKYVSNPTKYGLPPNPTIKDAIYKFDQTGASSKIKYIQQKIPNVNVDMPLSSLET